VARRAVLFDLDDTLYDHTHAIRAALHDVAAAAPALLRKGFEALFVEYDKALDDVHPRVVAGELTFAQARVLRYARLLKWCGDPQSDPEQLAQIQAAAYRKHERLVEHAKPLLEALRALALRLGIVTNSVRHEQQEKLKRLGVDGYFHSLTVSGDHQIAKPDVRLFAVALAALGVDAHEAVFVGDRVHIDVHGALAAGMRAVWFDRGWRDEGLELSPDARRLTTLQPQLALPILLD
jgi:HAD superfamily hydrolase (TIGR01549 family)